LPKTCSQRLHNTVLLKREDQQPVLSFKLRGAYNKMAHLTPAQLKKGVDLRLGWQPCARRGSWAPASWAARAVIVMPTTTPQVKVDAVKALGGEVVLLWRQLLRCLQTRQHA
jgi:threonine dehydratase